MKRKQMFIGVLFLGLLLALATGMTQAQGPDLPDGEVAFAPGSVAAVVSGRIPIQGRLTDAGGNPLNGTYSILFRLYDVSLGGTAVCSDTNSVTVDNGLFYSEILGNCSGVVEGQQLYLGITVETDPEMTPRQGIYPVPYASSLRPGAIISGSTSNAIVHIENWHASGRGLRVYAMSETGTNYGIVGAAKSPDGSGGYFYNTSASPNTGFAVVGLHPGYDVSDLGSWAHPAGYFAGRIGVIGYTKDSGGTAVLALINDSTGWAGMFTGIGNGIRVSVPVGKVGLEVIDGTKNAVVGTEDGARLLYTEESTEVWFTDYGFGELEEGLAVIPIESIFAQTVNLEEPYHVFVQVYGDAEVYVTDRTATGFEVHLRDGDPGVEFSYRIVGKRIGYEDDRLERAPWDDDLTFNP
jgi:hypothetical protein